MVVNRGVVITALVCKMSLVLYKTEVDGKILIVSDVGKATVVAKILEPTGVEVCNKLKETEDSSMLRVAVSKMLNEISVEV
jgi:hypothetical protein